MARFVDIYAPDEMPGYPCISSPRFSTQMQQTDSGRRHSNERWEEPLYRFTLPEAVREHHVFEALKTHWLIMRGPGRTWPFRDPLDYASVGLTQAQVGSGAVTPVLTGMDQVIGTGDGAKTKFQLIKTYTRETETFVAVIRLPVVSSTIVTVNGQDPLTLPQPLTYTVSRPGGIIEFSQAPVIGHVVRSGFLYDREVRFESDDSFDGITRSYQVSGFADINLIEERTC